MSRTTNSWPAIADLFSGLLVGCFGALMLFTGAAEEDPVAKKASEIRDSLAASLTREFKVKTRQQGDDVLIDTYLHFDRNKDVILPEDQQKIREACAGIKSTFESHPDWIRAAEIWIEGHTDSTQPHYAATERDSHLFNWRLSSMRANSVLYEFNSCGLNPQKFKIMAIGYADSQMLDKSGTEEAAGRNRRTTFRIRPDKCIIDRKILRNAGAVCAWE